MEFTEDGLLAEYKKLVDQRDKTLADVKGLQDALDVANQEANAARLKAAALAQKLSDAKNGVEWLKLKKNIAMLARTLSKPNGVLATK